MKQRFHILESTRFQSVRPPRETIAVLTQTRIFSANHGLIDQQCKSTEMLQQKFYREWLFYTQNGKAFRRGYFP